MLSFGMLAFLNPALLAALAALPVLWFLLRAIPPGPRRLKFPGVRLLLGLRDPEKIPERTPWWLLLLRMAVLAAAILGFAEPILNPRAPIIGTGPVLIVMDGGWASAPDWTARQARARELLEQAGRARRPVALAILAETLPPERRLELRPAREWVGRVEAAQPKPWAPDRAGWAGWLAEAARDGVETWWLYDGLAHDGADLAGTLADLGPLTMIGPEALAIGLAPARLEDGLLKAKIVRAEGEPERQLQVAAIGSDPGARERRLALAETVIEEGARAGEVMFDLPLELRNRISRLQVTTESSAATVSLTDEAVRRRKVGLMSGAQDQEGARLVSALHYLREALEPTAEVIEAPLTEMLAAKPDVLILADVGTFAPAEREALEAWVDEGGLLVRFAGPRLAGSRPEQGEDPLLPVKLREGGRNVGGTLSWGAPRTLRPFLPSSPFYGLPVPGEVTVSRQVMAQPDPELPDRTLAALEDGTPLVTARETGEGRVVLVHVTANAEWSNLPISGLFVQMLERLAVSARAGAAEAEDLAGAVWTPETLIDGFGRPVDAEGMAGVPGARLAEGRPGPDAPPGLYRSDDRTAAINLIGPDTEIAAAAAPPPGVGIEQLGTTVETPLKQYFLLAAYALLVLDLLATLWLGGRLGGFALRRGAAGLVLLGLFLAGMPAASQEAGDEKAIQATTKTVL
ncbi:MAG TPA: BatA domain-containing protein, partial [Paracoccaceae bacterium]|nr:BatA domain-containing protein [Paracoccaceae bacterium]